MANLLVCPMLKIHFNIVLNEFLNNSYVIIYEVFTSIRRVTHMIIKKLNIIFQRKKIYMIKALQLHC